MKALVNDEFTCSINVRVVRMEVLREGPSSVVCALKSRPEAHFARVYSDVNGKYGFNRRRVARPHPILAVLQQITVAGNTAFQIAALVRSLESPAAAAAASLGLTA